MSEYAPGTFAPNPARAGQLSMALAQGSIEAKLMLRHGEQLLLSVIIPVAILLGLSQAPEQFGFGVINDYFPMVLAIAVTSAGLTGQSIALAFDRRYGALKRAGASGVSSGTIIAGKIVAVLAMVTFQVVILGTVGMFLGLEIGALGATYATITLILGVATFTSLGLLLGGTLSSEIVLALANLIWFILLGAVGWVAYMQGLGDNGWFNLIPTVALAGGLSESLSGNFPLVPLGALLGWILLASAAANRWFRFDG